MKSKKNQRIKMSAGDKARGKQNKTIKQTMALSNTGKRKKKTRAGKIIARDTQVWGISFRDETQRQKMLLDESCNFSLSAYFSLLRE
jgi:hypothetical protein